MVGKASGQFKILVGTLCVTLFHSFIEYDKFVWEKSLYDNS